MIFRTLKDRAKRLYATAKKGQLQLDINAIPHLGEVSIYLRVDNMHESKTVQVKYEEFYDMLARAIEYLPSSILTEKEEQENAV